MPKRKKNTKRGNTKRSKAISDIRRDFIKSYGKKLGNKKFNDIFTSKNPKMIKDSIRLVDEKLKQKQKERKKGRNEMKKIKKEYCVHYTQTSY